MTKGKKIAAAIAAAAIATVTSVMAFAATIDYGIDYDIPAYKSAGVSILADYNYMYFNTRPSPPGAVHLTVTGPDLPEDGVGTAFPAQVSRAPLKISTVPEQWYYADLSADAYSASGTMYIKTSTDPNLSF